MLSFLKNIKGDRAIWGIVALLGLFSFLPIYSASGDFIKQIFLLLLGFAIIYGVHKVPTHFFKGLSIIAMPIVIVLLVYTLAQGKTIDGANASRWINIPFTGISFQTSAFATVILMVYVARYLAKIKDKTVTFKESILPLWTPVFLVVVLILPANLSTAAIIFFMVLVLTFLGGYPVKYLLMMVGTGIAGLALFILVAKQFPDAFDNRIDTWESRFVNFFDGKEDAGDYQIERAKIAIATGDILGKGSGKSVMKNLLPQSSSDFIYAIIIEEYGLVGGFALLFFYLLFLFRLVVIANGSPTVFGKLLAVGVGLPIVFQAFINMAVAVGLFPVTGQTLPLISSGGTSLWMTCLAIGIVLSASNKDSNDEENVTVDIDETNPLEVLSGQL